MIQNIEEASEGDVVIIRSHGEPESFYRTAAEKGVALVDSTCVFVTKIHDIVHKAHAEEKGIIIVGNPEHQEVIATNGWCDYRGIHSAEPRGRRGADPEPPGTVSDGPETGDCMSDYF